MNLELIGVVNFMDREMLAYFGDLLIVRLQELTRAMGSLHPRLVENEQHQEPMDEVEITTRGCEQKLKIQIEQRTRKLVFEIEEALMRIKCGKFGTCNMCGMNIEIKRLKVQPMSTLCVHCQREMEGMERRRVA